MSTNANHYIKSSLPLLFAFLLMTACSGARMAGDSGEAGNGGHSANPGKYPDHIILNLTEEANTSMAVTWRTSTGMAGGEVDWAVATDGPAFEEQFTTLPAQTERMGSGKGGRHYHSAILDGLSAGETYVYRVGNGKFKSEWFQFRMPAAEGPYSFIYFGDAQNDIKSMWSRVVREAYAKLPTAGFMLHAGDLINLKNSEEEWHEWFEAGSFIHAMIPSVMTPGNHEYFPVGGLSKFWRPQFTLPLNGPEGLEETCYFTRYRDLLVISLNSMEGIRSDQQPQPQVDWLRAVLEENELPWVVVTLHHPLYATKSGRDYEALRKNLQPILEEYDVDLVLQGHDHAYGRGHEVPNSTTGQVSGSKVMYVVSVSGPKMYELTPQEWMTRKARETQLFQLITIDGEHLRYEAYTATGMLYDAFEISKENGTKTILQDIPDVPERVD